MTARELPELRECPFCGKAPVSKWNGAGVPGAEDCGYWGIDCCNAFAHADTEEDAIALWNTRAAPRVSEGMVSDAMVEAAMQAYYSDGTKPWRDYFAANDQDPTEDIAFIRRALEAALAQRGKDG